jgi:cytochrome P450
MPSGIRILILYCLLIGICVGQQFALTQVSFLTVRLLQRFDCIETLDTDPVIKHNITLVTTPVGVNVKMHAVSGM